MLSAAEADRLATRARGGDAEALTRLYRVYAPAVLAYLRRLLGDETAAEDALQETFLRLIEESRPFRPRGRFREWLFAVASNQARDQRRRRRRRERTVAGLAAEAELAGGSATPRLDETIGAREALAVVEAILEDLPGSYAAAFHLRVREEFSYREIAAMTGEAEGTLRSRVHHTLRRLRDRLGASPRAPDPRRLGWPTASPRKLRRSDEP